MGPAISDYNMRLIKLYVIQLSGVTVSQSGRMAKHTSILLASEKKRKNGLSDTKSGS